MDQLRSFFSSYLPFNSLLQYIFQRVLGSYIKNDINISNFALGTTILRDLPLDQEKITEKFFKGTCVSLIDGKIGKFNLKVPWTSILQDSIEVGIEDMELNLSINLEKIKNNTKKKLEKSAIINTAIDEKLEALYDNKVDIFKKIISKILLNMKIELKNLKIKLFFNFGVFKINVGEIMLMKKKEEKTEKKEKLMNSLLIEELENYFLEINQISVFLAESVERLSHDEYSNKKNLKSLSINHPKCICTILEKSIKVEAKRKKISDELKYINISIPPIEIMLEPYQITLISYFFDDFIIQQRNHEKNWNEFEEKSKNNIQEKFNINSKKEDPNIKRGRSSSLADPTNNISCISPEKVRIPRKLSFGSGNIDNRQMFSFSDLKFEEKDDINQNEDFISTIINDYFNNDSKEANELKNLAEDVRKNENDQEINKLEDKEIDLFFSAKIEEDHLPLVIEAEISRFIVYIIKIDLDTNQKDHYARNWRYFLDESQGKKEKFNYKIPTSFFQIEFKNIVANFSKIKFEETSLKIRKIRILDIDLINESKFPNVLLKKNENFLYLQKNKNAAPIINQFSPEDSVIFHSIENSISLSFLRTKELQRNLIFFKLSKKQHYCAFYILNIWEQKRKISSFKTFLDEYNHVRFAISSINQTRNSSELGHFELKLSKMKDANKLRITIPDINLSIGSKLIGDSLSIMDLIQNKQYKKNENNNLNMNQSNLKKNECEVKEETKFKLNIKLGCAKICLFSFKDERLDIDLNDSNTILNPIKDNIKNILYFGHSYFCHCEDFKSQFQRIKTPCLFILCENIKFKFSEEIKIGLENLEFGTSDDKLSSILGKVINFSASYKNNNAQEINEADLLVQNLMQKEERKTNQTDNIVQNFNENKLLMQTSSLKNIFVCENLLDITVESIKFHFFIPYLLKIQLFFTEFLPILVKYFPSSQESKMLPISTKLNIGEIKIFLNENNALPIIKSQIPNYYEQSQKLDISIYQSTIMDFQPQRIIFNFEQNEEYIKNNTEESFMIILDDFNLAAMVNNKNLKVYLNLDDFLLIDGSKKNIHMDCPLKLVRGVKKEEMKKTILPQSKTIIKNEFEKVMIYKQASFWNGNQFNKNIENENAFLQLKSEFKDKNSIDVELAIQGMVFRPDLRLYQLDRLINFIDSLNFKNEIKEVEKNKNALKSQSNIYFKFNFYNIAIDLHPYYEKFDIENSPGLFPFKMVDLDFDKNGFFYANSRSLILIHDLIFEGNKQNQAANLIFSIQFKNIKYCLLQNFDFEARNNPLLLLDLEEKLNKYYDSLVQSLGFINILEVNGIKVENSIERIQIKINKLNLSIAEDSLKALMTHFKMVSLNLKKINSR